MSYGPSTPEAYGQAGLYVARILNGVAPAELPITRPLKFELVINAKTAKSLDVTLSKTILSQVDEIIE